MISPRLLAALLASLGITHCPATASVIPAAGGTDAALPFDRTVINRYSLDQIPRSLSLRQGDDVWFGYDLERGVLRKVWQAPPGKPGVVTTYFVARSVGTTWFEDKSGETWQLQRHGKTVPLAVRYRGCTQRETHFELTWELAHDAGTLKLSERIPRAPAAAAEQAVREVRVEKLAAGEALLPPGPARAAWQVTALVGNAWHRLTLP